jgi:hypothetical protein
MHPEYSQDEKLSRWVLYPVGKEAGRSAAFEMREKPLLLPVIRGSRVDKPLLPPGK